MLESTSKNNRLTADSGLAEGGEWHWFSVAASDGLSPTDNNSRTLADECERIELEWAPMKRLTAGRSLTPAPGSAADLNSDSLSDLYCFSYELAVDEIYYGGYIVRSSDLQTLVCCQPLLVCPLEDMPGFGW